MWQKCITCNEWRVEKGYPYETYAFYHRVYKACFNLKIQRPKKDQCDTCETFKNLPPENLTDEIKLAQKNHLCDKNLVQKIKEDFKVKAEGDATLLIAAFDLQKVLLCRFGEISSFYYSRRLTS